jgi:tetratricopeptide (TPR) repeat protein
MNKVVVSVAIWAGLCGQLMAAEHSHPPPERLGTVTFATSCAPGVAHDFERAVALLHSFAYDAAEKGFLDVAKADPTCAMAHWGAAMSYWHQLWSPPDAADLSSARGEIARAEQLSVRSERERQFIAAASAYFHDSDHVPHPVRAKAYEQAMQKAARANPNDIETQVFYALSLLATAAPEDRTHANQKLAASILEPIYEAHPDHPGVAHYLIHAYDSTELAARGLSAARAYSKIAPSAPHALHMPSHIFTRLGLWDDSIASNSAARAVSRTQGDVGEELHAMDYLTYAYLQRGRTNDAQQVVASLKDMGSLMGKDFKVGYAATAMPIRLSMEEHKWDAAAVLQPLPQSPPNISALVYWARAEAKSRSGHPKDAEADIAELRKCQQRLQAAGNAYWATQTAVLTQEAVAWQSAASSHVDEAVKTLRQAADAEDAVEKLPLTPGPIVPAREQLADLLLTLNQPQEALKEYQAALVSAPGRRGALTGAVQAADLIGDVQLASHLREALLKD